MTNASNSTANISACSIYREMYPDPTTSAWVIVPFAIFYLLIFVTGLVGNVTVMFLTLRERSLQTVQNIFILNLAASDVIVCLLSLPITPVTNVYKLWYFGELMCHLLPWVQGVSVFICTFSLSAIAIDRYILVVHPHTHPLNRRGAFYTAGILWAASVVVTLPYAFYMDVVQYEGICGNFCTEKWPNTHSRRAYTLVVLAAQFVFPFAIMIICYWTIFAHLRDRAETRLRKLNERSHLLETAAQAKSTILDENGTHLNGDNNHCSPSSTLVSDPLMEHQERQRQQLNAQTRRTTAILASMVIIFGLTWLPQNVVSIIMEYDENGNLFWIDSRHNITYLINLITHSLAMTNNVANPVLYAWLNPAFRELLLRTFASIRDKAERRRPFRSDQTHQSLTTNASTLRPMSVNGSVGRPATPSFDDRRHTENAF
uniref:G-protein coupled receptors family 1 profile domain-containing protein n=1 Tax=Plectus sambesii TaxID=2011161 RepID=A0A914WZ92_9BILA